ncbi:MAG: ABC transporter ATP-binding protein [Gammaproteobacteria bacterium]|nr:ABC transporter ATP-binding protein [Gammaproteobacteria bacterium]
MLKAVGLSRHYGTVKAADNVSFSVEPGEIVGLLGHNGAGKTTVMKLLTGYIEPTSGEAWVNDVLVQDDPVAAQAHIGYLPESQPFYGEMSVADYLMFAATMRGIPFEERASSVQKVVEDTDLAERFLDTIDTLSRGFQQRVSVAQAILHQPPVLILDEPTNGLDPTQTIQMRELIQRLAEESTVILSTHIMQEVDAICDRVLIMRDGELVVDERLDELSRAARVAIRSSASREQLNNVTGLRVDKGSEVDEFFFHVDDGKDAQTQINEVVPKLVEANISIYGVQPERQDLETLFARVSEGTYAS